MKVRDDEDTDSNESHDKEERRLQAVLALLGGAAVASGELNTASS